MIRTGMIITAGFMAAVLALAAGAANAKDKVKVGFIGPLTGGVSVNGIGGRNSADLAVKLRNADAKAQYEYELVVLDDECKPNVAVQVATKMAADKDIIAAATHYCSATAIATVDTYHTKARRPRSCRAANSSWKNTTPRNMTTRPRPMAPSPMRRWT
jgi:branched-chain amino acid transport system substrate-binding protein